MDMSTCKYLICFTYLTLSINNVLCKTIYLEENNPTQEEVSFLAKYGYIEEEASSGVEFSYTAHSISEAVRKMQAFAGLPSTGQLDADTRELFKKKRCGVKDIGQSAATRNRRYILQQGWNKRTISYRVYNGSRTLPRHRVEALMAEGLAVWAPHAGLRFSRVQHSSADIKISFAKEDHGDGFPFDGPGHVVAHAFPPPHGAMHFDDDEVWGERALAGADDDNVTDFFAVAVHEAGHALGLAHSSVKASVMYPYYQVPVDKLHLDDILGMQELYMKDVVPEAEEVEAEAQTESAAAGAGAGTGAGRSSAAPRFTKAASEELDENEIPDLCYTNYDTIQAIQGKIFVFEEEWMWVIKDKVVQKGYPRRFREVFVGLPAKVNIIKAIYEKQNSNIVIFSGKRYWEFNSKFQLKRVGRLTDYSIPRRIHELTTTFLSNYNNKTYLIEYERFWRYDEAAGRMDAGYPKEMSAWRQVPYPVDAALIWKGDTYFFRGPRFWRFDNELVEAHRYYPLPTAQIWFPCAPTPEMEHYFTNDGP